MEDDSSLEQELERLLEDEVLVSTPRQRLEDARAMADGMVLDCDDGSLDRCSGDEGEPIIHDGVDDVHGDAEAEEKEQETSTHLLQVSCTSFKMLQYHSRTGMYHTQYVRTSIV